MRTPRPPSPLPCFGLWTESLQPCVVCPHRPACQNSNQARKQRVPIESVQVELAPKKLAEDVAVKESLDQLYDLTHVIVYDRPAKDKISRIDDYETRYDEICDQLGCSRQLFMLAVMTSAFAADKDQVFWANMLFGPSAISRYEQYKEMCRVKFGQFDLTSIELTRPSASRGRFLSSEQIFGDFVIDAIINKENEISFWNLYRFRELAFDPFWLAIEDSYLDTVLKPHLNGLIEKTGETSHFRSNVAQARRALLKHKAHALTVFKLRGLVLKDAMRLVLHRYRLNEHDFLFEPQFTDAVHFWTSLGLAIRRVELLRLLGDL